ncbi:MAG: homoserine dehydrogenase [Acidobacteria bacterium]|nr:homoserine dehydrogenase [Acidobacteriota bacterium]
MMTREREAAGTLGVALVGFGTVGQSVARILIGGAEGLRLVRICNRHVARKRVAWVPERVSWTESIDDVLTSDVDVVVELIGGTDPALEWMRRALEAGKSVVTANKQAIAHHGTELFSLARRYGGRLGFEASVAGGIPVIRGIQEGLAADEVVRIQGILNGTCNFILSALASSPLAFETVLADAQAHGFAEADPSADLDGLDAQAKIAILSAIGLGRRVDPSAIECRSIRGLETGDFDAARTLGCAVRQVSTAERMEPAGVRAAVGPALVRLDSRLAQVEGSENVVLVDGARGGQTGFVGHGAGGDSTAVAVVADLMAIARRDGHAATDCFPIDGEPQAVHPMGARPYYLRVSGGTAAATQLAACGVSVARSLDVANGCVRLVTAAVTGAEVEAAIETLAAGSTRISAALPMLDGAGGA